MERSIGSTELSQQLAEVLQAVREERTAYVIKTSGRSQAALVNLDQYRAFQQYWQGRETLFDAIEAMTAENAERNRHLSEEEILAIIEQAKNNTAIAPNVARRLANSYLTLEVAMALQPGEPVFIWGDRAVWRMPILLHLRGYGKVAAVGSIEVDAQTGEVIALSPEQITAIQDKADAIARRLTLPATPSS